MEPPPYDDGAGLDIAGREENDPPILPPDIAASDGNGINVNAIAIAAAASAALFELSVSLKDDMILSNH